MKSISLKEILCQFVTTINCWVYYFILQTEFRKIEIDYGKIKSPKSAQKSWSAIFSNFWYDVDFAKKILSTKGQIISKGLLVSSNFPKKRTNKFVVVVKTNLFVCFLEESEDTKSPFEIIWPLVNAQFVKKN